MAESIESDLIRELRALGNAGKEENTFTLRYSGVPISVTYDSGSSSSISFDVSYDSVASHDHYVDVEQGGGNGGSKGYRDAARAKLVATRPLLIELRRELPGDVNAKKAGLTAEWQSGNPRFDQTVYVSTPTQDASVLSAVLGPEVREAVVELVVWGFRSITIDDARGKVNATLTELYNATLSARPDRGLHAIKMFHQIVTHLPRVHASGEKHAAAPFRAATITLGIIGGLGWGTNVGFVGGLHALLQLLFHIPSGEDAISAGVLAGVIGGSVLLGVIGSQVYTNFVLRAVRGTSMAHGRTFTASIAGFAGFSVIAFILLMFIVTWLSH